MANESYAQGLERRRLELRGAIAARLTPESHSLWSLHAALPVEAAAAADVVRRALREIEPGAGRITGGPFETLPAMALLCRWEAELPEEAVARVRDFYLGGIQERGNTENHWLMYYAGNLLAAQRWSTESHLWNGLPPEAMRAEATRWLRGMADRTAREGHHEYDSTGYHLEHVLSWIAIHDHSTDPALSDVSRAMLDLLLLDMALEYFHGAWVGGHSREGYRQNTWTRIGPVVSLQYLYFGGEEFRPDVHVHPWVAMALESSYRPPALYAQIAWDYDRPHAIRKTRAPRTIYRHVECDAEPVRKYTWRSRSFALGSTQLGLPGAPAGPIDLVSWDLSWPAPDQQGKIVCAHPYRSPGRFSAFLCDLPQHARRTIGQGKPYLQSPDRLFGASPFERMMQHEGTLIVRYRIPPDDEAPYVNLFLPRSLEWMERDGWIAAEAGSFYVALRPLGSYVWDEILETTGNPFGATSGDLIDGWLLRIPGPDVGLVLEAVEASEVGSFDAYCARRTTMQPSSMGRAAGETLVVQTTMGHRLEMSFDGPHLVDGLPIDYDAWPLYDSPWAHAEVGTGSIRVEREGTVHTIRFPVESAARPLPMRVIG